MLVYNLLEYSDNYSMTSVSLWNYYRDELNDDENETDDNGNKTRTWLKVWKKLCNICIIKNIREVPNADLVTYEVATQTTSATFQINNAKPYAPVITLSINDDIKFLENINNNFLEQI